MAKKIPSLRLLQRRHEVFLRVQGRGLEAICIWRSKCGEFNGFHSCCRSQTGDREVKTWSQPTFPTNTDTQMENLMDGQMVHEKRMLGRLLHLILWFYSSDWNKRRSQISSVEFFSKHPGPAQGFPLLKGFFSCSCLSILNVTNVISMKLDWLEGPQAWGGALRIRVERKEEKQNRKKNRKKITSVSWISYE